MELLALRNQIDDIDNRLLELILQRRQLVSKVGEYKIGHAMPVYSPDREQEIISRLSQKLEEDDKGALQLFYQILMDLNKLYEYRHSPKAFTIPTAMGGVSVRAILPDCPSALCRYLSPLAASNICISDIHSKSMPGGKLVVDIELVGDVSDNGFAAALSVLSDAAEKFTII